MSRLISVGTALPPNRVTQAEAAVFADRHFGGKLHKHKALMQVFMNTRIETRHLVAPIEWFGDPGHGLKDRNDLYLETAAALCRRAAAQALERAGVGPQTVDYVVVVSTTGMATPSLDADLIEALGMSRHTKRTPVWGLGCAGGVAGLARAAEFCQAYPEATALVVAVETCSITFQFGDFTKKNFVATSLFADGAAAAVIAGEAAPGLARGGLAFVGAQSTLFPDSKDVMGWDVVDTGLAVIFAPEIPARIAKDMRPEVERLARAAGLGYDDIRHFAMHPGGARVLDAYREALGIGEADLRHSAEVLRTCGNMSSPTVMFVLERALSDADNPIRAGEHVATAALGPGFSAELALWRGH